MLGLYGYTPEVYVSCGWTTQLWFATLKIRVDQMKPPITTWYREGKKDGDSQYNNVHQ